MAREPIDCIAQCRTYIDRIVNHKALRKESNVGKVMLLDGYTTQVLANVYSQTQILEKEFYLIEQLSASHEAMPHLKAAVFVRPTPANLEVLQRELAEPKFKEYHLFFSNLVPAEMLRALAESDEHELVKQVHEFYGDFIAVNEDLFTLGAVYSLGLTAPTLTQEAEGIFKQSVQGILALLLSMKAEPSQIRYQGRSQVAHRVAIEVQKTIQADGIFHFTRQEGPLVLLLDRMDDPVTPLLSQWTYQAMVHELLGLNRNRVVLKGAPNVHKDLEEVVLSSSQDDFFAKHRHSNYGDLGGAIKALMDEYQRQAKLNEHITSVEDMQAFMERYPAFRAKSHNVSKHVALMHELSRLIETHKLMDISQLEQEMACSNDHAAHQKALFERIRGRAIEASDKIRLALLYALRYEGVANLDQLKFELLGGGVKEADTHLIGLLLKHAGKDRRAPGLFGENKSLFSKVLGAGKTGLTGVENVYTQHVPLLMETLGAALKGTLREATFPGAGPVSSLPPRSVVVFILGGATYEESTKVAELNASARGIKVVLGANTVHNSSTFLAELRLLSP
jgi:vacuolar protein sorting-associated protein 45